MQDQAPPCVRPETTEMIRMLYEKHSQMVYSVALRVLRNPASAEDLMQEMFMELCRKPECFPIGHTKLPVFIAVATRNRCIDRLRSTKLSEPLDDYPSLSSPALKIDEEIDSQIRREHLWDLIDQLPTSQREALRLAFIDGLAHPAIATLLDAPLGTIKTRIKWGLRAVRKSSTEERCQHDPSVKRQDTAPGRRKLLAAR